MAGGAIAAARPEGQAPRGKLLPADAAETRARQATQATANRGGRVMALTCRARKTAGSDNCRRPSKATWIMASIND